MNHPEDHSAGKILVHGRGIGGIDAAAIERRARELAAIDGRSGADITRDDLNRAKEEMTGQNLPPTTADDEDAQGGLTRDPSEPASVPGHELPSTGGDDEEKAVERLALEGVEEAQHDQMLASRRREHRLDKGEKK